MSTKKNQPQCTLRPRKSHFVEIFRTTPVETVCPNFYVLSHANGCLFRPQCDYCYLKSSLWHVKGQEAFSNLDEMERDVRQWIAQDDLESYVLNTGNLSDSLTFEEVRPMMARLVEVFREAEAAGRPHALLLVTKGGLKECQPLLETKACANVIVSFSVNSDAVARQYERGAAVTSDRLEAARQLKAAGWRVRMRIDPMFLHGEYAAVADEVARLEPERVTLGTLRAEPHLLRMVNHGMFSELEPPANEHALARYPREVRMALYRPVVERLRGICPIGLCEETPDVWDDLGLDKESLSCNCGS